MKTCHSRLNFEGDRNPRSLKLLQEMSSPLSCFCPIPPSSANCANSFFFFITGVKTSAMRNSMLGVTSRRSGFEDIFFEVWMSFMEQCVIEDIFRYWKGIRHPHPCPQGSVLLRGLVRHLGWRLRQVLDLHQDLMRLQFLEVP